MLCVTLQMSIPAKHWDGLLAILACSDAALRQVVQRWPGIAELTEADIMQLLMCLKVSMPPPRQSLCAADDCRMCMHATSCCRCREARKLLQL